MCCHHHCRGCHCYPQLNNATIRCWRCGAHYWSGTWHSCPTSFITWGTVSTGTTIIMNTPSAHDVAVTRLAG